MRTSRKGSGLPTASTLIHRNQSDRARIAREIIQPFTAGTYKLYTLAGGAIGISFLCYLLGWMRTFSYLNHFKAEQLIYEMPVLALLSPVGYLLANFTYLCLMALSMIALGKYATVKKFRRMQWLGILSMIVAIVGIIFAPSLDLKVYMTYFFGIAIAVSCGFGILDAFSKVADGGDDQRARILPMVCVASAAFFVAIPNVVGQHEARRDLDVTHSRLLVVTSKDLNASEDWRLLFSSGDRLYVVQLSPHANARELRVVHAADVRLSAPFYRSPEDK